MADLLLDALPETVWEGRKINADFRPMVWLANQYLRGAAEKDPLGFTLGAFQRFYGEEIPAPQSADAFQSMLRFYAGDETATPENRRSTAAGSCDAVAFDYASDAPYIVAAFDPVSNIAFDYADKIRKDREERKAAEKAEAENAKAQAQLDAQYAAQSGTAEKKQLDAKYNKKLAELEKAKLTKDDPGMLEAEKKVLAAGYEQDLADLEKKVLDAQYKLASAQLEQKTATDATRLAELEKQINEAQNVIHMSDLEKQLLGVEYQKSLAELIAKYQPKKDNTSSSGNGSSSGSSGTGTPAPAPDTRHDEVIAANTAALQEANKKLSEMVRQANALVLSDNMKVSSRVAASGTAQVAAAANNYHREGDTTVNQYIYSKAQSAADLARETRWEADRAKARKT